MTTPLDLDADHARRMEGIYRYQRHFYDITRKHFLLGRDRLIAGLDVADGGDVLELGCGTGRNLIEIASRFPGARLHGLDISAAMLKTAIRSARAAGVRQRIDFRAGDASDFDPVHLFGTESFDRIVLSYALSMIPPWQRTIDHALRHLAPGGSLHIVDFGQQREIPQIARHALRSWLARFHVTPRSRLFDVVSTAAERRGACVSFDPLYRDYAWLIVVRMPESGSRDTGD